MNEPIPTTCPHEIPYEQCPSIACKTRLKQFKKDESMTDDQKLKAALAKMLPGIVARNPWPNHHENDSLVWSDSGIPVLDTELLHLCWCVEEGLTYDQHEQYAEELRIVCGRVENVSATWQQRIRAACKVKGVEI